MNLRSIDLNLLVALEALLEERHVTRAAERVGVTQPAMSSALKRLRTVFADELLVRTPRGMEPTPRGVELGREVAEVLRRLERVLDSPAPFDPATSRRLFTLRLSDLLAFLILPGLMAILAAEAPRLALEVMNLAPERAVAALEADEIDLVVSTGLRRSPVVRSAPLLPDRLVCVLRAGHPAAAGPLTTERFLALQHAKVASSPTDPRFVDGLLAARGLEREVALNLPHWLVMPAVIAESDLALVASEQLVRRLADPRLAILPLPFETPPIGWSLYWHRRYDDDTGHRWMRDAIARACPAVAERIG